MTAGGASLLDRLAAIEGKGLTAIGEAADSAALESARVEYLGRNGQLADVMSLIGTVEPPARRDVGQRANAVKTVLRGALEERAKALESATAGPSARIDLTLPARGRWVGGLHPVTRVIDEICEIFAELGFTSVLGPEIESTWYNFTALNIPLDHPAADMMDTFYLDRDVVLRTHTSPVQARVMEAFRPPVRVVVPGLAYRRDSFDPSHAPAFEQIEGLAVDEGVDFVEFRAAIEHFVHHFFGPGTKSRFRPSFYPFTEPSAEVDVSCTVCAGSSCSTCKRTGWITIMGSGMVDPSVFEAVGYDPERYTGYAFGMGPARIAMVRHGIPDMRLLYEGEMSFLQQFA
ncbi:MAG: phenylalanine--tRNA ligase subunit alpha [Gemmatimonadota bacterium]|uniref:phenylalanine--tRNA ligase subunit alpha n=1 Tax=Candidatus Palauibacter scopulicola TaxID=3056741 RepID=UPI0023861BC5|nr:phenylalanine--tRNA ligase subunit alpha [Candidatus Palauibacter scopulicola]MDE2662530.1 phenylalanine--tRNA ligase subunit alpha [Candidatus Palauibacter scopulicola]